MCDCVFDLRGCVIVYFTSLSVAKRVAEEAGCRLGEEVGYTIRFEDLTTPQVAALNFATVFPFCLSLSTLLAAVPLTHQS